MNRANKEIKNVTNNINNIILEYKKQYKIICYKLTEPYYDNIDYHMELIEYSMKYESAIRNLGHQLFNVTNILKYLSGDRSMCNTFISELSKYLKYSNHTKSYIINNELHECYTNINNIISSIDVHPLRD